MEDFDDGVNYRKPGVQQAMPVNNTVTPPMPKPVSPSSGNPLAAYFRVPGLHITIPTNGAFLPEGSFKTTASGEIPVYPMRAADEILLRSPDALMSGYAIERMLESCVPAISSPEEISMPDVDVLFLAIRVASYGEKMEVTATCPQEGCEHENTFDVDLPSLLETMKPVPSKNVVRLSDDVVVYLKPFSLRDGTTVALATYNETRKVQAAEMAANLDAAEKTQVFNESFRAISEMNSRLIANAVVRVVTPTADVTDRNQIEEFIANIPSAWFNIIDDFLKTLNALGMDKNVSATCAKCGHVWQTEVQFDPSNFSGRGY